METYSMSDGPARCFRCCRAAPGKIEQHRPRTLDGPAGAAAEDVPTMLSGPPVGDVERLQGTPVPRLGAAIVISA
jgi:hypothetical protein